MNARVTILHDAVAEAAEPHDGAGPDVSAGFEAEVLSLEQPFMELMARQQVESGTALRIDTPDAVWLGEAEQCFPDDGGFSIRVRLRHVLRDFETLARLVERFGGTAPRGARKGATVQV